MYRMSRVQESKSRSPKAGRYASPLKHPGLEVGRHTHGFCGRVATHSKGYDSIWVIIDRFTKSAHFIPVKTSYTAATYLISLHGVPVTITSDRGSVFVSRFWEQLQKSLGTKLIHSSAYHPQTSGQVERVNQILEDMLRACVLTYSTKWDECLPLASLHITTATKRAWRWLLSRLSYGRRCEHLRTGRTRRASYLRARFGNTSRRASEVHTGKPKKGTVKAEKLLR
ncbi:hypothetical protein U9M48_031989 [Paspalum notatum var. saurae]|uniref:Integrase catalytic domain-containing protein n=1 Tax=Paspalum notatum var. saurae TaxID=547442 RepID=A0AAQ3X4Y0_PASNO